MTTGLWQRGLKRQKMRCNDDSALWKPGCHTAAVETLQYYFRSASLEQQLSHKLIGLAAEVPYKTNGITGTRYIDQSQINVTSICRRP